MLDGFCEWGWLVSINRTRSPAIWGGEQNEGSSGLRPRLILLDSEIRQTVTTKIRAWNKELDFDNLEIRNFFEIGDVVSNKGRISRDGSGGNSSVKWFNQIRSSDHTS